MCYLVTQRFEPVPSIFSVPIKCNYLLEFEVVGAVEFFSIIADRRSTRATETYKIDRYEELFLSCYNYEKATVS